MARHAGLSASRCQTAPGRSPDERSDIRDPPVGSPHVASLMRATRFFRFSFASLPSGLPSSFHSPPRRGAGGAPIGARMLRASGCVHDRTRALTFEARARRRSDPTPRLSALHRDVFWTGPSALLSLFPGPGSNGCSLGSCLQGRWALSSHVRSQTAPGTPHLAPPYRTASGGRPS